MTSTLTSSLQEVQTWIAEQMSFTAKIRSSQGQALQSMHTDREMIVATFDNVKSTLQSLTATMKLAAEALTQGLDDVSLTLKSKSIKELIVS